MNGPASSGTFGKPGEDDDLRQLRRTGDVSRLGFFKLYPGD
jgi:hypothetical protein